MKFLFQSQISEKYRLYNRFVSNWRPGILDTQQKQLNNDLKNIWETMEHNILRQIRM